MMKTLQFYFQLASTMCLASVIGCSARTTNYSSLELVDVRGIVKLDGKPVPAAVLVLQDVDTGSESFAMTKEDGTFRMQFDSAAFGVPPGEKRVIASTTKEIIGLNADEGGEDAFEGSEGSDDQIVSTPQAEDLFPESYRIDSKLRLKVSRVTTFVEVFLASDGSSTLLN